MANPEYPEFPREEYVGRRTRARELMEKSGFQALLITSETNYRYLTGHWTQRFVNKTRIMLAVLGIQDGDPILVIPESEKGVAQQTAWTEDIRTYSGPPERSGFFQAWANVVRDAFSSLKITGGRVGAELGSQLRLGMSVEDFNNLCAYLKGIEFVDAGELLWRLRTKKSPREMEYMRKSAEITSRAFDECGPQIRVGMTERDVFAVMVTKMIELGAERPGYNPVRFHNPRDVTPERKLFIGGPTDRVLNAGDAVDIDAGCIYRGYWSDFNRMFSMGEAPEGLRDAYKRINEAIGNAVTRIKPGYLVKEIARFFRGEFEKAKIPDSGVGRMGHGIGLDMPEPPSISDGDDYRVEPGTMLCIEPSFFLPGYGIIIAEEQIAVTNDGCEVISKTANPELVVL